MGLLPVAEVHDMVNADGQRLVREEQEAVVAYQAGLVVIQMDLTSFVKRLN